MPLCSRFGPDCAIYRSMAKVLVTGGAGYVGSAVCAWLVDAGHFVWVLDDLSTGHRDALLGNGFTLGQYGDQKLVSELLKKHTFDAVLHFAARSLVGESVEQPELYHQNNVVQTERFLDVLLTAGVRNLVFSSSCAVFGDPSKTSAEAIGENLPKDPQSPYGLNKLKSEQHMERLAETRGLKAIALRYFNAAGTEPKLRVGERHLPETHLIPKVLHAIASDRPVEIYGTDYPTADGTCIRDYVHVWDLAEAHGQAMQRLLNTDNDSGVFEAYNLGSESGYSVLEVIRTCEEVIGKKAEIVHRQRRAGDPARLIANSDLAKRVLAYRSQCDLKSIIQTAWSWEQKCAASLRPAIFLDRDGTLNDDPGYLSEPSQMKLFSRTAEALSALQKAGFLLIVISNQSGVGRGLIEEKAIPHIHARLDELLYPDAKIDRYMLCFHLPNENCACRKPKASLFFAAAKEMGIDLARSIMVGDRTSDIQAGIAAGCKATVLVRTGYGAATELQERGGGATFVADSLFEASKWILSVKSANS